MDVVGVAAAGITFGALILKLSQKLYKSAKKIAYARRELLKLIEEMGIFSDLYEDFRRVCISDRLKKGRDTSSTRRLVHWIRDAIAGFKELENRVRAIAGDARYSTLETLTARVKWFFSENELKYLRSSLRVARESMRGFSNATTIETINEEMEMIRDIMAQGDRQVIEALEDQLGVTLGERLLELKQTNQNRRTQRRAINSRMQEYAEVLEHQSMKIGVSDIVPKPKRLLAFTAVVEKYADQVRNQCRTGTSYVISSGQQFARAASSQPTNSTASGSSVSKPSSHSETVATASTAISTEELDETSNPCGRCTGVCACSKEESHHVVPVSPSSQESTPPPLQAGFEHTSHRFDRSWQQPDRNNVAYQSTIGTYPAPDDDPPEEVVNPNPEMERTMKEVEKLTTVLEADWRDDTGPNHGQVSNDEECESDDAEEVVETSEDEARPSPFQPVAGVQGRFPRHWRKKHDRSDSPDDYWHRRL